MPVARLIHRRVLARHYATPADYRRRRCPDARRRHPTALVDLAMAVTTLSSAELYALVRN
ncbi:MAG: hypothetical protein ABSF89_01090 [Acidimicrobiales bacterium]|jgi:hypothetical protein